MPGVPAGTTNALMPPRPALLSTVAHTTTKPPSTWEAPSPPVQKILVPFRTYSSPSRSAVVWMLALSLPACGSVMAMAPQAGWPSPRKTDRNFAFCSFVPAAETAEPPSPANGVRR